MSDSEPVKRGSSTTSGNVLNLKQTTTRNLEKEQNHNELKCQFFQLHNSEKKDVFYHQKPYSQNLKFSSEHENKNLVRKSRSYL